MNAPAPTVLMMGRTAVLVDVSASPEPLESVLSWHAELVARPLPGQLEALPAAATVLLRFSSAPAAEAAVAEVKNRVPDAAAARSSRIVTLPVEYSGEDLEQVARLTGLSVEAVIAAHTGSDWTAAFGGFAPGFLYLTGGDPRLNVPRRSTPRTAVPAGSVALAGAFSAVYPQRSPGGWQLLGRTDAPLWDASREQPSLIRPGDVVRFEAVRATARAGAEVQVASTTLPEGARDTVTHPPRPAALEVLSPGLRTVFQDLGRPGLGELGVTASGAADRPSSAQANRLVGNPDSAAVLETLLGGLSLRAQETCVVALTGAVGGAMIDESVPAPVGAPFALYPGHILTLGQPASGLRGYVAMRGGFAAERVLGSASLDTLSGLGPAPLTGGQALCSAGLPVLPVAEPQEPATELPNPGEVVQLRVSAGPRADWVGEAGLDALQRTSWVVGPDTDRVGARLRVDPEQPQDPEQSLDPDGQDTPASQDAPAHPAPPIARLRDGELASEGMVPGALQLPPSGLPVLFLADHPVTGGYPVIAVVEPHDLPLAAQLPPGTRVRFRVVEQKTAPNPPHPASQQHSGQQNPGATP
ncbi:5-oxoprolinase subunit B/C family protein [Galactobacter caseinivorans]|nr:carboxyltransferase domain-containing protein [Galactobacter caseinivorans]